MNSPENIDQPASKSCSRRSFLFTAGIVGTGVAAVINNFAPNAEMMKHKTYEPELSSAMDVGNITLHPLITEHEIDRWYEDKDFYERALSRFPTVSPEYFPPE